MSAKEQIYVVGFLLVVFLYHYINLSLRVRRIEKGVIYTVSLDKGLMTAISFAEKLNGKVVFIGDCKSVVYDYTKEK